MNVEALGLHLEAMCPHDLAYLARWHRMCASADQHLGKWYRWHMALAELATEELVNRRVAQMWSRDPLGVALGLASPHPDDDRDDMCPG